MKKHYSPTLIVIATLSALTTGFMASASAADKNNVEHRVKAHKASMSADAKLASTNWQGTHVIAKDGQDITALNNDFMSFAKYDAKTNRYEFFDQATGKTKGDRGVFFITQDGKKRVLISQSKSYQAVVDMVKLDQKSFVYARPSKLLNNEQTLANVYHVPYHGHLEFTEPAPAYKQRTGTIDTHKPGRAILAATLWAGTVVLDSKGQDVSAYNQGFLGLSKWDAHSNKYEFFDKTTGATRGDYGYYDVINDNKVRATVSIGKKYAAVLELTELNQDKFTYARKGKDANGNDIDVNVEHVPYKGEFTPEFTF